TLRCRYRGGRKSVVQDLMSNSTIEALQEKLWLLTDVPPHAQRILSGFPPHEINCKVKTAYLSSLGIRSGDTLIVEVDRTAPRILNTITGTQGFHGIPLSRK
ncbi:hypothetical protein QZH41_018939, partial [Actinostola sp. cb2023]